MAGLWLGQSVLWPAPALATELPEGYTRVSVAELDLIVLVPEGWRYINNKGKLLSSFVLIEPSANRDGRFRTGLTVYAIDGLSKTGKPLEQQVESFARQHGAAAGFQLLARHPSRRGRYAGIALRYRDDSDGPRTLHREYLADPMSDRLLVITFESPAAAWPQAWTIGRVIIDNLLPDD